MNVTHVTLPFSGPYPHAALYAYGISRGRKKEISMNNSCEWRVPKMWGRRERERMSLTCLEPFVHRPFRWIMWVCEAHFRIPYFFVLQENVRCIWNSFRCIWNRLKRTWNQEKSDARSIDCLWIVQTDSFHGANHTFHECQRASKSK
jgi:hypothetical protein